MKKNRFLILSIGLIFLTVSLLFGCASRTKKMKPNIKEETKMEEKEKTGTVTEVRGETLSDKTLITIQGTKPLAKYMAFENSEPLSIVVDVADVNLGPLPQPLGFKNKVVKEIKALEKEGKKGVEITIFLAEKTSFNLYPENKSLVLKLDNPEEKVAAAAIKEEREEIKEVKKEIEEGKEFSQKKASEEEVAPVVKEEKEEGLKEEKKVPLGKEVIKEEKKEEVPEKAYTGTKISLDFQDADINNILRLLSEVSGLNIISSEDVKGKITIRMANVPWDQALDVILKTKALGKEREGNIIRIATLERLNKERKEVLKAKSKEAEELVKEKESKEKLKPLQTKIYPVSYASVKNMKESIEKLMSERGHITIDERTNVIILKDVEENIDEVSKLIKVMDKQTPQVSIETRIVESNRNFGRELGIRWGGFLERNDFQLQPNALQQTGGKQTIPVNADGEAGLNFGALGGVSADPNTHTPGGGNFIVSLPAGTDTAITGPLSAIGFGIGNIFNDLKRLDIELSAAELNGRAKVLSTPKVTTLDNKEAVILTGERIPFSTVSQEGTETIFIDAVLSLKVTPHVTPDDFISMKITATRDAKGENVPQAGGGTQPAINKTEVKTEVLVRDGNTTVIGGIFQNTKQNTVEGVPFLKDIPALGWLFKKKLVQDDNDELLIFLTPKIVKHRM